MILIIFVFDPLAIAMVIAANMAFANIKGVARDPKDYEVYQPEVITKEVEVEKIVEIPVNKKLPKELKSIIEDASKHARRSGKIVPTMDGGFFED